MAEAKLYVCDQCQHSIQAWSDGNPYYINQSGKKKYAYHPDHEKLALCIGNDSPHLCLTCGKEFMVDSQKPRTDCPKCHSDQFVDLYDLDDHPCPYCKQGKFKIDTNFSCIS
jgi:DNA-directed RNA polymerase subunit RPC12/RpoP